MIEAVAALPGVEVGVISGEPSRFLSEAAQSAIVDYQQLSDVLSTGELLAAARRMQARAPIHRLLGLYEYLQVPLAEVREALGVDGMRREAAQNFREKARMKELWRAAGLPCAQHRLVTDPPDALRFADAVGYPVVLKPPAGTGASATFRVRTPESLRARVAEEVQRTGGPVLLEEHLTGEERSLEAASLNGQVLWQSSCRYPCNMLALLEQPTEPYRMLLPRELPEPGRDAICELAPRALRALGMETGVCHLEWFHRPDGSVALTEVAARPPGGQITKLISYAHDADFLRAWARLVIFGAFELPPRQFAAGVVSLRGHGQGRVQAVTGLEEAEEELGELIAEARVPKINQPGATEGYEGEGYVILRHPETSVVEQAMRRLVSLVQVRLA